MHGPDYILSDVESSLPTNVTLPERRAERAPIVKAHGSVLLMLAAVARFKAERS